MLHMYQYVVIKVTIISIKEKYMIVDRGGAAYLRSLGRGFNPPVSIHIPIWCVIEFPVQCVVGVKIFRVLLGLVHNFGWNEAFTVGSCKDK